VSGERPLIVTFIGDLVFLGALLSIISLFPNFTERFEIEFKILPIISEGIIRVLIPISLLIVSYGYLKLKRWGYWLMVTINMFFLIASIIFSLQNKQQSSYQSIISTFITLIFVLPTKKYFGN